MQINKASIDRLLSGETTPEETLQILAGISLDPELEEYAVTQRRLNYASEQMEDYGSYIPAGSMAADDGRNLCDFQCESYILRASGIDIPEEVLLSESRKNYWLKNQGTPLFNMGKLLEKSGFLVNRSYDADLDGLTRALEGHSVIAVVNGDVLEGKEEDILSDSFSMEDNPNHAVVVLHISMDSNTVRLFNPAANAREKDYDLDIFENAWAESRHYIVTARRKSFPEEYNPQPIDIDSVSINPELLELTELIAENAHDIWAVGKFEKGFSYSPLDADGNEVPGHNHFLVPYAMLSEEDKEPDRQMAIRTIKLVKRLGYRLVNINSMYRCPECGEVIEPSHNYCPNCGCHLSWEDFK